MARVCIPKSLSPVIMQVLENHLLFNLRFYNYIQYEIGRDGEHFDCFICDF